MSIVLCSKCVRFEGCLITAMRGGKACKDILTNLPQSSNEVQRFQDYNPSASSVGPSSNGPLMYYSEHVKIVNNLTEQLTEVQEVIKEARKFMNRLPAEWFSEQIAARLDDIIGEKI